MSEELNEIWLAMKSTKYNNAFKDIQKAFSELDDLDVALKKGLKIIVDAMHAEAGTFWFYDFFGDERIRAMAVSGGRDLSGISLDLGEGIAGSVIENCQAVMISDCQKDPRWAGKVDAKTNFVTRSMICTPLFAPNAREAFGCIQFVNKNDGLLFDKADLDFAGSLTTEFANAFVENYNGSIIGIARSRKHIVPAFEAALAQPTAEKMMERAEAAILDRGYSDSEVRKILRHLLKIYDILHF